LKRLFLMVLPVAVLLGLAVAPASADEGVAYHDNGSWQDCQTLKSRISTTAGFHAKDYDGNGTYYVKWTLKWQVPGAARWRERDRASGTGPRYSITNGRQHAKVNINDVTGWGNAFTDDWRVWIRITLYKERAAAPDIRFLRDRIEKSFYKPRFDGRNCFTASP
jgi:hypothetical protein